MNKQYAVLDYEFDNYSVVEVIESGNHFSRINDGSNYWDVMTNRLMPLIRVTEFPDRGEHIFEYNKGWVHYFISEDFEKEYPDFVHLECIKDLNEDEYFKKGHLSCRRINKDELYMFKPI